MTQDPLSSVGRLRPASAVYCKCGSARTSLLSVCVALALPACDNPRQTRDPVGSGPPTRYYSFDAGPVDAGPTNELLFDGYIERVIAEDAWNGEFVTQPGAHVVFNVVRGTQDARNRFELHNEKNLVYRDDIPVSYVPFTFEIKGNRNAWLAGGDVFLFYVNLYNHAGEDFLAGDLLNEEPTLFLGAPTSLKVHLTGLESCTPPQASLCAERLPEGGIPVPIRFDAGSFAPQSADISEPRDAGSAN
jgi:hypothetical protein